MGWEIFLILRNRFLSFISCLGVKSIERLLQKKKDHSKLRQRPHGVAKTMRRNAWDNAPITHTSWSECHRHAADFHWKCLKIDTKIFRNPELVAALWRRSRKTCKTCIICWSWGLFWSWEMGFFFRGWYMAWQLWLQIDILGVEEWEKECISRIKRRKI